MLCLSFNFLNAQTSREIRKLMKRSTLLYCKVDTVVDLPDTYEKNMEIVFKDTNKYTGIYLQSGFFKKCHCSAIKCEYIELDYKNGFIKQFCSFAPEERKFTRKFNKLLRMVYLQEYKEP